ncbi:type I-E CRISPR-associated protein Cse2/CasB [Anaerolineae bacterium CFX9]|nr:type I-E CRISPR-associated protein Cse2/CasB [Anaerolineae bacterium CFX9]
MTEIEQNPHPFITHLERLADDRAALAELRRGLGRDPGEAAGMFPYVVPFISSVYDEDLYYLIASLFALSPESARSGNMGEHLRIYAQTVGDDTATTRRFTHLLRQRRSMLAVPLRQHISMLKSKEIAVNWHQLMRDLQRWDSEERYVQKQWANAYWKPETPKSTR